MRNIRLSENKFFGRMNVSPSGKRRKPNVFRMTKSPDEEGGSSLPNEAFLGS
jgi:hypothetical protein